MKPIYFTLPVVVLLVGGYWIASQNDQTDALEKENAVLRRRISAARAADGAQERNGEQISARKGIPAKSDWLRMGQEYENGQQSRLFVMRLDAMLKTLNEQELLAALDEVDGLSLDSNAKSNLLIRILQQLAGLDSAAALNWLVDSKHREMGSWTFLFANWMLKDPAQALAWYDQKIPEGAFASKALDGKNQMRSNLEGLVISYLLKNDPSAIIGRLENLPPRLKKDSLQNVSLSQVDEAGRRLYIQLLRDHLPEQDVQESFGRIASSVSSGADNYAGVTNFLKQVQATPAERDAAVRSMGSNAVFAEVFLGLKTPMEAISSMRAWAVGESPQVADEATAQALDGLVLNGKIDANDAISYLESCLQQGGEHDELIAQSVGISLLSGGDRERMRALASKITNEEKRNYTLEKLK